MTAFKRFLTLFALALCVPGLVLASDIPLEDPALEARARALFTELRCTVCEGQALAGSQAKLAIEMRNLIRTQLKQGKSNQDIMQFFAERYGQEILMKPPMQSDTLFLWAAPAIFLLIALTLGIRWLRRYNG